MRCYGYMTDRLVVVSVLCVLYDCLPCVCKRRGPLYVRLGTAEKFIIKIIINITTFKSNHKTSSLTCVGLSSLLFCFRLSTSVCGLAVDMLLFVYLASVCKWLRESALWIVSNKIQRHRGSFILLLLLIIIIIQYKWKCVPANVWFVTCHRLLCHVAIPKEL